MKVAHDDPKHNNFWMGCESTAGRRQRLESKQNEQDGEYEDSSNEPRARPRNKSPKSSEDEEVMDDYDPENEDYYFERSAATKVNEFSKSIIMATVIFTLNLFNSNFYS